MEFEYFMYICRMVTFIYTLSDPRTGTVRYIGKTVNPKQRKHNHSNKARDKGTHKRNWINQLKQKNLKPVFEILDEVTGDWKFWERHWIQQFKAWGFSLTNTTLGGEGLDTTNSTSFKPGQTPWNKGSGFTKPCEVCGSILKTIPSTPKATCSKGCEKIYRENRKHLATTTFKPGSVPWNKNKLGYSTSKKGQKATPEQIEHLRLIALRNTHRRKQVNQYTRDMKLIETFESVTQAKQITGIKAIGNVLTGRCKTAGGFIWQF